MIDYEKLELAHELIEKLHFGKIVSQYSIHDGEEYILSSPNIESHYDYCFTNLHDLIAKLKELTQPKPKYKVGEEVWLVGNFGKPITAKIVGIMGGDVDLAFKDGTCRYGAIKELYPTKSELIEAQIEYWTNLQKEFDVQYASSAEGQAKIREGMKQLIMECQHERDESEPPKLSHFTKEDGCVFVKKCQKCGEFYR